MPTNTRVFLLNVPLQMDYQHTFAWKSLDDQINYFSSKVVKGFTDYTYQRKDKSIRVNAQMDSLLVCNYVMYKNEDYSNKWFFAFVKDMTYVNDNYTDIIIETDVLQTWYFEHQVKTSFVEREHVKNDTIGLHTIPEQVETGEYVCNSLKKDEMLTSYAYVLLVTELVGFNTNTMKIANFGGIPTGYGALVYYDYEKLAELVELYDKEGKSEAIIGAFMCPPSILDRSANDSAIYESKTSPTKYNFVLDKPTKLNGYTPRNKKLLTSPYQYLILSNNAGTTNVLQFEHFSDEQATFEVEGIPVIGGSIKCVPKNYKGAELMQDEGIMAGKFPTLSWSADLYTNWLTQNAVNISVGMASSLITTIVGAGMMATGVGAGIGAGMMALGGATAIGKQVGQIYEHSFTPNSAKGNINGGDINTANKMNTFYYYSMSIKKEYAEVIDAYFDMYGYKVNKLKTPEKFHRQNYWFTKLIDANIQGAIPQDDLKKIVSAYNNGITFWSNTSNFRNYDVDNSII